MDRPRRRSLHGPGALNGRPHLLCRRRCTDATEDGALRWAILVAGDLPAACLAYLLAFVLRTHVPLPLTQGYLPGVRLAEVHHHRPEMLLAQGAVLYFLGL